MDAFRVMIRVDESSGSVTREADRTIFWELVKKTAEAWEATDV